MSLSSPPTPMTPRVSDWRDPGKPSSEPRDVSPHESGSADPSRRAQLHVHAVMGKQVFQADGRVNRHVDDVAMRESGEERTFYPRGGQSCLYALLPIMRCGKP